MKTQFEHNIINSFQLAKEDIYKLSSYMKYLQEEVSNLKTARYELSRKLAELDVTVMKLEAKNKRITKITRSTRTSKKSFVSSRTSTKFHEKKCVFAKNIKPKNKKLFSSKNTALNQGLKACVCAA